MQKARRGRVNCVYYSSIELHCYKCQHLFSSNKATLIDLALVSNVNYVQECSVITPLANSNHNSISPAIKRKKSTKSSTRKQVWKYSQADFSKASDLIDETDWEHLFHGKSVDEACCIWQEKFLSIMEQCIPKGVLPKKRSIPWASRNIRRIILKKKQCIQMIQV